ncbi:MAG: CRISPR-associated helicase Cas3' [Hyphomicrobiaceae bacterium]|nr:CRISPR-associated helicase Cas3' [Hyphomicrobiaceae bacterium]
MDWAQILKFWGKSGPWPDGTPGARPLLDHLLDVAAVAEMLGETRPAFVDRLAGRLDTPPETLMALIALLAGLHDLGKLAVPFQAKRPELWPEAVLGVLPKDLPADQGHWRYTALILQHPPVAGRLVELLPGLGENFVQLLAVVAGHHGVAPERQWIAPGELPLTNPDRHVPEPCLEAGRRMVEILIKATRARPLPGLDAHALDALSFLFNGWITTADWIGSDSAFFAPAEPPTDPAEPGPAYQRAKLAARRALQQNGLVPLPANAALDWTHLGLPEGAVARPMQQAAAAIDLPPGPCLAVIEDRTGGGKTEAALRLAARMMQAGKGEGLYFALPTMATANAMHGRIAQALPALFAGGEPSLVLAHGRASLARRLTALGASHGKGGGESVAADCNAWIADNRRKAFFADVGAGTVDQAFLAVLRKKHLGLRQFALSGRILIVDEAHSFDSYMDEELKTLIGMHARNGGSAIILSATLTGKIRSDLVAAFHEGLARPVREAEIAHLSKEEKKKARSAQSKPPLPIMEAYPMLTLASGRALEERPVALHPDGRPDIAVQRISSRAAACVLALERAADGAAVAIIANAVDEAIAMYGALAAQCGERVDLFHARFAMGDRMDIETRALSRFGKKAEAESRKGRILVGTQVLEQSLDLDFDVMISDLAPADNLIQRAGRLWRHMDDRPAAQRPVAAPVLTILSPDLEEATHAGWLEESLGAAAFVYKHPGVMWRSAKGLFSGPHLPRPDTPDFRALLEEVYREGEDDLPACLTEKAIEAKGDSYAHKALAKNNLIHPGAGYCGLGESLSADETIGTRLGEETVTIRLARREAGKLVPWARHARAGERLLWELSEVSVRKGWLEHHCGKEPVAETPETAALRAQWPEFEQAIRIAEVGGDDALRFGETASPLTYNRESGLYWFNLHMRG